jgi:hypothetical protein
MFFSKNDLPQFGLTWLEKEYPFGKPTYLGAKREEGKNIQQAGFPDGHPL